MYLIRAYIHNPLSQLHSEKSRAGRTLVLETSLFKGETERSAWTEHASSKQWLHSPKDAGIKPPVGPEDAFAFLHWHLTINFSVGKSVKIQYI